MKRRINGISVPFGGISWEKYTCEKDRIRYLFIYLESKRILTNPIEMELPEQCISSVLEIRATLIDVTKDIEFSPTCLNEIRNMIKACNTYLDKLNQLNLPHIVYKDNGRWADLNFDCAMKKFRRSFRESILNIEENIKLQSNIYIPEQW